MKKKVMSTVCAASRGGPLVGFLDGFAGELERLGYSPRTIEAQQNLAKHLSRWLAAHGLVAADLDGGVIDRFVTARRGSYVSLRSERAWRGRPTCRGRPCRKARRRRVCARLPGRSGHYRRWF